MAVATVLAIAVIRALTRNASETIGNFRVAPTRATLHLYLPLSIVVALVFVALGVPIMAPAGGLAAKTCAAPSAGTFPPPGPPFVGLLIGVIVIVGLLSYFPALALGPIVEHLLMFGAKTF